ncbi:MAG: hypothetical protein NZ908_02755 [Candidatus Micrarchaeota archaeon]|nr:hypothetical protein [Candidatus Micrarchaeota archaeon]MCX8154765.1 hypothetical protein [Candidatus Micrarchaeota archaeon]
MSSSRPLYRLEFIYLIRELKTLEGQILDNAYRYGDVYRMKFRTTSVNFQIPYRINLAYIHYPSQSPDRIVQKLKSLSGSKLSKIDLVDMDRMIRMEFDSFVMYLEFFGKGNIIIDTGDDRIYTNYPNPGKTKPLDSDWNVDSKERYIGTVFGKIYVEYLKDLVSGNPLEDLKRIENELKPYWNGVDFRVLPAPGYVEQEQLSPLIEKFYELKIEVISDRYRRLLASREKLLNDIEYTERKIQEYTEMGDNIMKNYELVEREIERNRGKGKIYLDL